MKLGDSESLKRATSTGGTVVNKGGQFLNDLAQKYP
eukprot:CAMPEP_0201935170 /NCGR_PEP_ID=MMETSP0903-20130614/34987_1 /ASSEMBLY_ACC=CAM_ASM_000552 /TAXON_ID=420261 /ORGANISM="Thalassiosira antarctica, Strain CCMP982" /LENGTH=35 /DNA_ID= /DNA_START= /DNA_END= /DNA_ORIENTATION=